MKLDYSVSHVLIVSIAAASTTFSQIPIVSTATAPVVNLGYARYQGYYDSASGLNVWKGIRYADSPTGEKRWQAPRAPPSENISEVILAQEQPPLCPQSGAAKIPKRYGLNSGLGNEDCLFLNVYAPPDAKNLPVFFWLHGGGYGVFGATNDPSPMMNVNANGFISVIIQYRLGAFGFLSSEEVHQRGKVNAGLLDQHFALQWVQKHIKEFGGDATRVTIAGESAGAGSVMLQAMAYGGNKKPDLFHNLIAASVYLPQQYDYNDPVPTQNYLAFANAAGCACDAIASTTFDCLVNADTLALQNASMIVSESGNFGTFAFIPVTDGDFLRERPSEQLVAEKVKGKRLLTGNNANDGAPLSPPTVENADDFLDYISSTWPRLSKDDVSRLLQLYEFDQSPVNHSAPLFDTLGDSGPTALNQSEFGTGAQQRLFNVFAENTFSCPSYWLSEAFAAAGQERSWRYQFSVTPGYHGADLKALFSVNATTPTKGFIYAFQKVWGNFIINNNPIVSIVEASGNVTNATVPQGNDGNIEWPTYSKENPVQMNFNTTGGTLKYVTITDHLKYFLRLDPGVTNSFRLVNAKTWEGGRGARCDFWREVAPRVPN